MFTRTTGRIALTLAATLIGTTALAQSEDWVEGTITENNVEDSSGELVIEKSETGEEETYRVTSGTKLDVNAERDAGSILTDIYPRINDIEDLKEGDQVKLNIREEAGQWIIIGFARSPSINDPSRRDSGNDDSRDDTGGYQAASGQSRSATSSSDSMMAQNSSYDSLPSTASSLPLVGLLSGFSLLTSVAVRRARKRQ